MTKSEAIEHLKNIVIYSFQDGYTDKARQALDMAIKALEEPERKKGRWIRNDNGTYSCSVCQSWIPEEQHLYARYCLYCGAYMR